MIKALTISPDRIFFTAFNNLLINRIPSILIESEYDSNKAIKTIDKYKPDIIFIDGSLYGDSGFNLTRQIKIRFPIAKVFILTNYDVPEYCQAAKEVGADYCLTKEYTSAVEILDLIKTITDGQTIK